MAQAAEQAGAESLWVGDHVVTLRSHHSVYPYAADGQPPGLAADAPFFEALTAMSWIAASTERARVGAAIIVLPQREPVLLAKMLASLDTLSGGRIMLGVGAGWLREELELLGAEWRSRGRRTEEAMAVMRACWTGEPDEFHGEFFALPPGVLCYPVPAQEGGIPILMGGTSAAALRRSARVGDGWIAVAWLGAVDVPEISAQLAEIERARQGNAPFTRVVRVIGDYPESDQYDTDLRALAELGFDEVILEVPWESLDRARECIASALSSLA